MNKQYVENIDSVYRLAGTRVSLDSIVYAFWRGQTAESIAQSFPVLTLEHVYGALTFYLANKSEIDVISKQPKRSSRRCGRLPVSKTRCSIKSLQMHAGGRHEPNPRDQSEASRGLTTPRPPRLSTWV